MVTPIKSIFKNGFMYVSKVKSTLTGSGEFVVFGRNNTKTGAIIVPITKDGKIMLVREYRIGANTFTTGVPKGAADVVGEAAVSIAERELKQEIGASFSHIVETNLTTYPLPAFADFSGQVVYAFDVEITSSTSLEEGECIEFIGEYTKAEVSKMLSEGRINDAESVMALQAYLLSTIDGEVFK